MKLENIKIIYDGEINHERMKNITRIVDDFDLEMGANVEMSMRVAFDSGTERIEFCPIEKEARVECKTDKLPDNYKHSLFFGGSNNPTRLVIEEYSGEKHSIRIRDYVIYT